MFHCRKDGQKKAQVAVALVPLPMQGHLNQLLHFARLISSYNIPVHYVSSATHNCQAKHRVHGWKPLATSDLHFHEFRTPHFLSPPPDPNAPTKFPSHLQPSLDASLRLRKPVAKLLCELSARTRRVVVIHDSLMAFVVQDVASIPNAESYSFHSVSAFAMFFYFWEAMGRPFPVEAEILSELPSPEGCFTKEFKNFIAKQHEYAKLSAGRVYNTCKIIEGRFLDLLAKEQITGKKKQWALGPFNPVDLPKKKSMTQRHRCLEWLDKQAPSTVLYVSFGTTTSLTGEQITELAVGLERSKQKFIWVLRDADKGNVFAGAEKRELLPEGYEEKMEANGSMVVRDWAPQLEILGHPSTGGCMSHCGWNSCMECMTMGVPIAAWPMHSDQPRNTVLVAKLLRVGLVVRDWARRDELVTSTTIERAVTALMATREGGEIRRRAAQLGAAVRGSAVEGGDSRMELDSFVAYITR